jgi:hypothetical protein
MVSKYKTNKKGQFDVVRKSIFWLIIGVAVTMAIFAFAMILASYSNRITTIPPEFEAEVISLRFTNIPECFTYQDSITKRVYPGIIDLEKFTQERLNDCYRTEVHKGFKTLNFGIKIQGYNPINDYGEEVLLMTNNYFNKNDFTIFKEILVLSDGKLSNGRMVIFVQNTI